MARSIMVQGTMSNVGKSVLTAGLCRIFAEDGYSVAPFKSQNMALNSYITSENLEMGRAQAVQAEACYIEPNVSMNPILLKPTSDMGSQVIINGEVVGDMSAREYFANKRSYIPIIKAAYEELAKSHDIIVIEGAGSPAEINLKKDDIVNMGMAELVDAPVLLAADIDRGGVFAQLLGTIMLLEKHEKERIKGLIINKFRGDISLLQSGLDMIARKSEKKVVGVVPYMNIDIESEDSLAASLQNEGHKGTIDIAVIRLPRISNFTDFQPLAMEREIQVRYINRVEELGAPDAIIIPGTKNTIDDLKWLRWSGLELEIARLIKKGVITVGICGGYQILGESIDEMKGMGVLPLRTVFEDNKHRKQVSGYTNIFKGELALLSRCRVSGYELHMGRTEFTDKNAEYAISIDGGVDGCYCDNVLGTYIHGLFDSDDFRGAFVKLLYSKKGQDKNVTSCNSYQEYKEKQFTRLAATLRESLDMKYIYKIMEIGKD